MLGTLLMDVKLRQAMEEKRIKDHIQMSYDAAKVFLAQFEIEDSILNNILHCIEAHHGTIKYDSQEAEICANADCYSTGSGERVRHFQ